MLRQEQELKPYKKQKNFEDMPLFMKEEEIIPIKDALGWAVVVHFAVLTFFPLASLVFHWDFTVFNRPKIKSRDIEFVLVAQPEKDPINKNTPFRADRNTQAGGIHDPSRPISPPLPSAPQSAPSQPAAPKVQKQVASSPAQTAEKPKKVETTTPPKQEIKKEEPKQKPKPAPPKPTAKASLPASKSPSAMKLPVPPSKGAPKIAAPQAGPITSNPSGKYSGSSASNPKPVIAAGGYGSGSGSRGTSTGSAGRGSGYSSGGGGNMGNPGPGNPNGAPGIDAIREPNFGPYMSELQRRIKANWDPPRGDESKRVVLLFKIAKDGRLLSVKVVKTSGSSAADRAALAAVELTAPFRALPSDYRGNDVDIQFTFDYNVFGVNRY